MSLGAHAVQVLLSVMLLKNMFSYQQLEQSQKEASDLLEQNRLLQDQLRVALGREQSAREGYVLQVGWAAAKAHGAPGASVGRVQARPAG